MFSREGLWAPRSAKTLALTYDDGPGPHTIEIAEYLSTQGVRATFFVVGKYLRERPDVIRQVVSSGHAIGNHTDSHQTLPNLVSQPQTLPNLVSQPERLIEEVLACDREIQELVGIGRYMFRAPGGAWSQQVADILNGNNELRKYVGPINWDIDCADYDVGRRSPHAPQDPVYGLERCEANYLERIRNEGSGTVLLHDWCANDGNEGDTLRRNNRTLELTKWLIPRLRDFQFVSLDQVV
jgi:peptidoglycan/xylan/chitin deacetylase (PgdA/CDA1 family)